MYKRCIKFSTFESGCRLIFISINWLTHCELDLESHVMPLTYISSNPLLLFWHILTKWSKVPLEFGGRPGTIDWGGWGNPPASGFRGMTDLCHQALLFLSKHMCQIASTGLKKNQDVFLFVFFFFLIFPTVSTKVNYFISPVSIEEFSQSPNLACV